ncbi:hypothetical protein [Halovenus marina]|uniref:hypothetical protein n=1 Tax=Halovenus marina TaxID=3396621 RepID=UPI003F5460AA
MNYIPSGEHFPNESRERGGATAVSADKRRSVGGLVGYLIALGGLLALLANPALVAGLAIGVGAGTVGKQMLLRVRRRVDASGRRNQPARMPTARSRSRPSKE